LIPFSDEAKRHFDRVATMYGLLCSTADERQMRYESDKVFLDINFDNGRSYELGVEIGQRIPNQVERPFSLAEILRLKAALEADTVDGLSSYNATKLKDDLQILSNLTLRYADDFLKGDVFSFARVANLREKESIAYAIQRDLRSARAKAEKAWAAKDYTGVISAFEPVKSHLRPSEVKRLEYSSNKKNS
jgi:hypothetical protein